MKKFPYSIKLRSKMIVEPEYNTEHIYEITDCDITTHYIKDKANPGIQWMHCENGPARIVKAHSGLYSFELWCLYGLIHRLDGPAWSMSKVDIEDVFEKVQNGYYIEGTPYFKNHFPAAIEQYLRDNK